MTYVAALATSTQTPVDLAAMISLSVLATALAKKARIALADDWTEPLNLFTAVPFETLLELRRAASAEAPGELLLQSLLQTPGVTEKSLDLYALGQQQAMGEEGLEPSAEARSSRAFAGGGKDSGAVAAPAKLGRPLAESTVTLSHDDIRRALDDARHAWARSADPVALRKALLELLAKLGGVQ